MRLIATWLDQHPEIRNTLHDKPVKNGIISRELVVQCRCNETHTTKKEYGLTLDDLADEIWGPETNTEAHEQYIKTAK